MRYALGDNLLSEIELEEYYQQNEYHDDNEQNEQNEPHDAFWDSWMGEESYQELLVNTNSDPSYIFAKEKGFLYLSYPLR